MPSARRAPTARRMPSSRRMRSGRRMPATRRAPSGVSGAARWPRDLRGGPSRRCAASAAWGRPRPPKPEPTRLPMPERSAASGAARCSRDRRAAPRRPATAYVAPTCCRHRQEGPPTVHDAPTTLRPPRHPRRVTPRTRGGRARSRPPRSSVVARPPAAAAIVPGTAVMGPAGAGDTGTSDCRCGPGAGGSASVALSGAARTCAHTGGSSSARAVVPAPRPTAVPRRWAARALSTRA